jgi:N-acetylneuraminate synthase
LVGKLLGSSEKNQTAGEKENASIARRSLVAAQNIKAGESLSIENIVALRPGEGVSPMEYFDLLGKVAKKNYSKGDFISES